MQDKFKYEIEVKVTIKIDGEVKHTINGITAYCTKNIKERGWQTLKYSNGIVNRERKFLVPKLCDQIIKTI